MISLFLILGTRDDRFFGRFRSIIRLICHNLLLVLLLLQNECKLQIELRTKITTFCHVSQSRKLLPIITLPLTSVVGLASVYTLKCFAVWSVNYSGKRFLSDELFSYFHQQGMSLLFSGYCMLVTFKLLDSFQT